MMKILIAPSHQQGPAIVWLAIDALKKYLLAKILRLQNNFQMPILSFVLKINYLITLLALIKKFILAFLNTQLGNLLNFFQQLLAKLYS
ncbi:hypothetical protein AB6G58_21985 [Providencia huaxiensis]